MDKYFSKGEAEAKVGKRIRTLIEWSGVPEGTEGKVVAADSMGKTKPASTNPVEVYDVVVEWDLPDCLSREPLRDWFTKEEYQQYLEEL